MKMMQLTTRRGAALTLAFSLPFVATPLLAADWNLLGRNEPAQASVLVDSQSLAQSSGQVIAPMLVDYDGPRPMQNDASKMFRSAVQMRVVDCARNLSGVVSTIYYPESRAGGTAISSTEKLLNPKMEAYGPQTFVGMFAKFVCDANNQPVAPRQVSATQLITEQDWAAYEQSTAEVCATDHQKCTAARNKFLFAHWPAPKATASELAQPCRDNDVLWANDGVRQYANSGDRQQRGGPLLTHWVGNWAGEHFPNRAYDQRGATATWCSDSRFRIAQWQRAVGLPETGRITKADVDDFVNRWAPVITRLNQISQVRYSKLEAAATDKAQAVANRRAQERDDELALYANGPKIFDVALGSNVTALPKCGRRRDNPAYAQLTIVVEQTCFEPSDNSLRFPAREQPSWVRGGVKLILDGEDIVGMEFGASNSVLALQAIDSRFGAHQTIEVPMRRDATVLCNAMNECIPGMPAASWVDMTYIWDTEKLYIRATQTKGEMFAPVTVQFKPLRAVRKLRIDLEKELGENEPVKEESQQKRF